MSATEVLANDGEAMEPTGGVDGNGCRVDVPKRVVALPKVPLLSGVSKDGGSQAVLLMILAVMKRLASLRTSGQTVMMLARGG